MQDINEIIIYCASTVWQERKDGLVSLRHYLSTGIPLSAAELKRITDIFTRMFMDSHTKGMSVFLDTLNEVIAHYKDNLHDWLYVLLQRIFHKLGTDLLNSTHTKLVNTLENVKKAFPVQLQFLSVYRFLVDATQTPNTKVKVAVLTFLSSLCNICDSSEFATRQPAQSALQKVITYSQDSKSMEIRNAAKNCIVALYNCNTSQVAMLLSELPQEQNDIAMAIVRGHLRKASIGSEAGSPRVVGTPKILSPTTPVARNDVFNQEEMHRSLRRTAAEIQNYSYEGVDREREPTSRDSGISQMSLGNDEAEIVARRNFAAGNGPRSLPYAINGLGEAETGTNGCSNVGAEEMSEGDVVRNVQKFCGIDSPAPASEKQKLLGELAQIMRRGPTEPTVASFRLLLRLLIDNLDSKDQWMQILVLQVFTEMFKNMDTQRLWSGFTELIILRILNAHSSEKREVSCLARRSGTIQDLACSFSDRQGCRGDGHGNERGSFRLRCQRHVAADQYQPLSDSPGSNQDAHQTDRSACRPSDRSPPFDHHARPDQGERGAAVWPVPRANNLFCFARAMITRRAPCGSARCSAWWPCTRPSERSGSSRSSAGCPAAS